MREAIYYLFLPMVLGMCMFCVSSAMAGLLDGAPKVSVDFRDADVKEVLRVISDLTEVNILASEDVKGKVTISLKEVGMKEALEAILTVNQLSWSEKGDILIVESVPVQVTEFIQLRYADAAVLLEKVLLPLKSDQGIMLMDARSNKLIIRDFSKNLEDIKRIVDELDKPTSQVTIQAKIVELTLSDSLKLGLNVSTQRDHGNDGDDGVDVPNHASQGFSLGTDPDTDQTFLGTGFDNARQRGISQVFGGRLTNSDGATGGFSEPTNQNTTFNFVGETFRNISNTVTQQTPTGVFTSIVTKRVADLINIQLDALIEDKKGLVLASPTITTLNNETATIIIGKKVGIKEQTQTTTGTTETTRFQDVGTKLEVTPQINSDGYVTMSIVPEISDVQTFVDDQIIFTTREARTRVRVKNHHTLILGGLISSNDSNAVRRVPFISRIPLLGNLFKAWNNNGNQIEMVVFLTPHIAYMEDEQRSLPDSKANEEALAKEQQLLERFGYSDTLGFRPFPKKGLDGENSKAELLYNEAMKLYRKGKRLKGERGRKILQMATDKWEELGRSYASYERYPQSLYYRARILGDHFEDITGAVFLLDEILDKFPEKSVYRKAEKFKHKLQRKE